MLGKFQTTANCYGGSNVVYMLMLHSKYCINVPIGSRSNTWSENIWNVPNLLLAGKWQVPSTRAYNVLKMFLLVSRPPCPQWLVDPKTHIGTSTIELFFVMILMTPLCLWLHVLCLDSFFVMITSYHTFLSWLWQICLLSAPLWFHCLHSLYCYLFLANWSVCCPALNLLVYN